MPCHGLLCTTIKYLNPMKLNLIKVTSIINTEVNVKFMISKQSSRIISTDNAETVDTSAKPSRQSTKKVDQE